MKIDASPTASSWSVQIGSNNDEKYKRRYQRAVRWICLKSFPKFGGVDRPSLFHSSLATASTKLSNFILGSRQCTGDAAEDTVERSE
jgi:hypothetical protein